MRIRFTIDSKKGKKKLVQIEDKYGNRSWKRELPATAEILEETVQSPNAESNYGDVIIEVREKNKNTDFIEAYNGKVFEGGSIPISDANLSYDEAT